MRIRCGKPGSAPYNPLLKRRRRRQQSIQNQLLLLWRLFTACYTDPHKNLREDPHGPSIGLRTLCEAIPDEIKPSFMTAAIDITSPSASGVGMVDAECPSFQVGEDAMGTQQDDPAGGWSLRRKDVSSISTKPASGARPGPTIARRSFGA
jgi:hypothetical protein